MTRATQPTAFSRSLRLAAVLVCVLIALFSVYVFSEKQIDRANEQRYQFRLLADELRQSSDDLTRMVRTYVLTGKPEYKQHYLDILDIREGRKPRPLNYEGVYWDLMVLDGQAPRPDSGVRVALLARMRQAGLTEEELGQLAQAKLNSDKLTGLEFAAMALIETAGPDLEARRLQAGQMLYDADYHRAKVDIMRPINAFYELLDQRSRQAVHAAETRATALRILFILVGLALMLSLWRTFKALQSMLGGSVDEVHQQITHIGQGNFSELIAVAPGMDQSVLGWLAQTQRQLRDMASARQASDAKLQRLTRIYAAFSECNQAIVRCGDETELFTKICQIAVEDGGMKMAWIGRVDRAGMRVVPVASYGTDPEQLQDIQIGVEVDGPYARGPGETAIRGDQAAWCQDCQNDAALARWRASGQLYRWAASAGLPLHRHGEVCGIFNLYSDVTHVFDQPTQDLLLEMASDIDFALNNFDREAERVRNQQMDELRSFMLERLTSDFPLANILNDFVLKIEDTLPGRLGSILLLDDEGQRLHLGAAPHLPDFFSAAIDGRQIGPQAGSCGTAAFTRQRVIVEDIATHPYWVDYKELAQRAGLAACWSEPVLSGSDQVLGTFAIYGRVPCAPKLPELALIRMAAHLAAIAIERKRAEVQLQLKSRVFEQASESIVITDSQRRIIRVNRAFSDITGYSEAEALGRNPNMLASGRHDSDFYRVMWESIRNQGQWQGEIWNRRKDGTLYPEWISIGVLRDRSGVVMNYVGISADISQRRKDEERIRMLADFDPLTGLPNRRLLRDRIDTALIYAQRQGEPLALMFLDLDRFKNVNDSLGHHVGDTLLTQVAQRLGSVLREQDTVSRVGGDEFVLLCTGIDAFGASRVASKLLELTEHAYQIEQVELVVTFSIGIALYPTDGATFDALLMSADTAMYRAKHAGRNAFRFFAAEMQVESSRTLQMENGLRRALDLHQFHLVYQPLVSLRDGHMLGMEVLLRWQHPKLGQVPPVEFIRVAEESGLILPIAEWVLRTATRQLRAWLDAGLPTLQMAVNLSAVQFRHANLPDLVTQILAQSDLQPQCLELELTESVAMHDPLGAIAIMDRLHQRGVRMSIDDFGTGYSSLSHLKRFKVYKLKIDQSFVHDITSDPDDRAIIVAVIALARSLGFLTIAEGVETEGQMDFLQRQGCDEVQGHFISEPLLADDFEAFVRAQQQAGLL